MGHQVLQLGLANSRAFLPLSAQIYRGKSKQVGLNKKFADARSPAAVAWRRTISEDKITMACNMIKAAKRAGIKAKNILCDSWFTCKRVLRFGRDNGFTVIGMMKRGTLKFRWRGSDQTAKELYVQVERRLKPVGKTGFKTASLIVEVNLAEDPNAKPVWCPVKLVFSKQPRLLGIHGLH